MNSKVPHANYFKLRPLRQDEEEFLKEMLFEAIYLPLPLKKKLSKDILLNPDLIIYYQNWGRRGDIAFVAEHALSGELLACTWGRLFTTNRKGYGFLSESIPEISIAVIPGHKNKGIGTSLIRIILKEYFAAGFKKVSLSVSKENPCINLYRREGFIIHHENENDYLMTFDLSSFIK